MKKALLLLVFLFSFIHINPVYAQDRIVSEQTITIEDDSPSIWARAFRGVARVVTFGAIQTAADTIKANQQFVYAVDHDGIDTDSYELLINTAVNQSVLVTALVNGTVQFQFPNGLPKGTYKFVTKALGPGGEGVSPDLDLSVTAGNPSNPRNPRIIKGGQ